MKQVFSVSQLNSYIRRIFESDYALKRITIQGEVSNCKYHSSGHVYFSLKDDASSIKCVMFAPDKKRGLTFRLENGQQVTVSGRVTVFERDGAYQLYAKEIEQVGTGERYLKLEKLKQELFELGYFDFERKKDLPPFAQKIGIVTAVTGAAIEDIKSVARRRNPYVQLYLYPAKVQGDGAAQTIARGIDFFDSFGVDVIIIGRGGGSTEDLWAFNERCIADAIFRATTPIISGTGHEVDTTIADYCADVRAATPTAACEIAIFDIYSLMQQIDSYRDRLDELVLRKYHRMRECAQQMEKLLEANNPGRKIAQQKMQYKRYEERLHTAITQRITNYRHQYEMYLNKMDGVSPLARLRGGYVYAYDKEGIPLSSVSTLETNERFYLKMADGEVEAKVVNVYPEEKENGETI